MTTQQKLIGWAGIALILATGLIHLINAQDSFDEAQYKGLLFLANAAASLVAAVGIYRGSRTWGWGLGLVVAVGSLIAYALSRTVGLPGLEAEPDAWFEPMGAASLVVELLFTAIAFYALGKAPARSSNGSREINAGNA